MNMITHSKIISRMSVLKLINEGVTIMDAKLANGLFVLRVTIAIVFIMWTGDKFINPVHAESVWSGFFYMPALGKAIFLGIGIAEAILVILFLAGIFKGVTYLIVLVFHGISTLAPVNVYLNAYSEPSNLLFFTAFPMLGACFFLYMFRAEDTKFTIKGNEGNEENEENKAE